MIMNFIEYAGDTILFCSAVIVIAVMLLAFAEKAGFAASAGYALLVGFFTYWTLWLLTFMLIGIVAIPVGMFYMLYSLTNWVLA